MYFGKKKKKKADRSPDKQYYERWRQNRPIVLTVVNFGVRCLPRDDRRGRSRRVVFVQTFLYTLVGLDPILMCQTENMHPCSGSTRRALIEVAET